MALVDIIQVSDTHDSYKVRALADYTSAKKKEGKAIYATLINGDYDEGLDVSNQRMQGLMGINGLMTVLEPQLANLNLQSQEGVMQLQQLIDSASTQFLQQYLTLKDDPERIEQLMEQLDDEKKPLVQQQLDVGKQIAGVETQIEQGIISRLSETDKEIQRIKKSTTSGKVVGTLGNHDLENYVRQYMPSLEVVDGDIYNLNGIKIFGHSNLQGTSAYSQGYSQKYQKFLYDQEDYAEKFKDEKIDFALLHNGIQDAVDEYSMSGYKNNPTVESLVNNGNTSYVMGGHTHRNKIVETDHFKGFASSHVLGYKHTYDTDTHEIVGTKALLSVSEDLLNEYSHMLKPVDQGSYYKGDGKKLSGLFNDDFYKTA